MRTSRPARRKHTARRALAHTAGSALLLAISVALGSQVVRHSAHAPRSGRPPEPAATLLHLTNPVPSPSPRVVLVRPIRPLSGGSRRQRAAADRVSGWLQDAGVPFHAIPDTALSLSALRPYRVAVLPLNRLSEGNVQSLRAFVAQGGRILAICPEASPALFSLLGAEPDSAAPAAPGPFRRIALSDTDPNCGFPPEMEQPATGVLPLKPAPGTQVVGWWQSRTGDPLPAIIRSRPGILVGHPLTSSDPRHKRAFLLAALGGLDPGVWTQAAHARRLQAQQRLTTLQRRWTRLRRRPDLAARQPRITRIAAQVRQALQAPPGEGPLAYRRVSAIDHHLDRLESALTPAPKNELRGFWIHTYRPTDWDGIMRQARAGGLNAAFVRVGRGGSVIYPGAPLPRDAWAEEAGGDELRRAIDAARRHRLQFHAWRVLYHLGSASPEYRHRMAQEDRLARDPNGRQYPWANPADPRNQDLECRVIVDLVRRYSVDGVHLDYVRYPDDPHCDFDYGPVSRREFERAARVRVQRWPADVRSGPLRARYEEWQRANITRLVRRLAFAVKQVNPNVRLSAAVWRDYPACIATVRQDWPRWVRAGWLDFVVPMNYVLDAREQADAVRAQIHAIAGARPLLAGIGTWQLQSSGEVLRHIQAARQAGARGFVLFSYNDDQIASHLEVLAAGACASP